MFLYVGWVARRRQQQQSQIMIIESKPVENTPRESRWKTNLKYRLYDNALSLVEAHKVKRSEERRTKLDKVDRMTEQVSFDIEEESVSYPHGYHAFYISTGYENCNEADELVQKFPYFSDLHDKQLQSVLKQVVYVQIGSILGKLEESVRGRSKKKQNDSYMYTWQRLLEKYICPLDTLSRLEVMAKVNKYGTAVFKQSFREAKLKCQKDVFVKSVLSCCKYLRKKVKTKNPFSITTGSQINDVAMTETFKVQFCPICVIYDCPIHPQRGFKHQNHHFVAHSNYHETQDQAESALHLMVLYQQIKEKRAPIIPKDEHCSNCCYQGLTSIEQIHTLSQQNKFIVYSPIQLACVSLGVSMFQFDPCSIWNFVKAKAGKTTFTCEMVFLYFIYDCDLVNRISQSLHPNRKDFLFSIKKSIQKESKAPLPKRKKPSNQNNQKNNVCFDVCHHYYLNSDPKDKGCRDCYCAKRGYCLRQCMCSDECDIKRGCQCSKANQECLASRCPCKENNKECVPGLCLNCFDEEDKSKVNKCKNNSIILRKNSLLRIGTSTIPGAGLGLFAAHHIKVKQMVCTYTGQIISREIENIRERLNLSGDFYNFDNKGLTIDSRYMGNKSRFINHGNNKKANVRAQNQISSGKYVITFYATKDIPKEAELFFDYDGDGKLAKDFLHKYPFIKAQK